ncbi:MAG: hypothetical protein CVV00_11770 [Firmicutes bacterium HGW-Firmicutes-5]|jgi:transcriptional regulator with XRE-family HTH domain|nr:MAG: hypothetical protein CVV00_11770 [Firmicutes bacterium HGW-Firmicutes-5]
MSEFKEKLRCLREERDLTRADLSKILKVSVSSVTMYERGERMPSLQSIKEIAHYFKVDFNYLLDDECDVKYSWERNQHYSVNDSVNENQSVYVVDHNARDVAAFIHENPEYLELFEVVMTVKKEEIIFVKTMIEKLK